MRSRRDRSRPGPGRLSGRRAPARLGRGRPRRLVAGHVRRGPGGGRSRVGRGRGPGRRRTDARPHSLYGTGRGSPPRHHLARSPGRSRGGGLPAAARGPACPARQRAVARHGRPDPALAVPARARRVPAGPVDAAAQGLAAAPADRPRGRPGHATDPTDASGTLLFDLARGNGLPASPGPSGCAPTCCPPFARRPGSLARCSPPPRNSSACAPGCRSRSAPPTPPRPCSPPASRPGGACSRWAPAAS